MKLNLGCGHRKYEGFLGVDKYEPADMIFDLETFPWPWEDNSIEEVILYHSLEHMGQSTSVFLGIVKELYRVCAPDAKITITVPYPRHDCFLADPTHVRAFLPGSFELLSKANNIASIERGWSNTPLAIQNNIDFVFVDGIYEFDKQLKPEAFTVILKANKP